MAWRQVKFSSNESGLFSNTDRVICNLDIPADGVFDLKNSYLALKMQIDSTETGGTASVHNVSLSQDSSPQSVIKNIRFTTENNGIVEDLKEINRLFANKRFWLRGLERGEANEVYGRYRTRDWEGNYYSVFRDLERAGTKLTPGANANSSVELEPVLRVPLADMLGIAQSTQFPTIRTGRARIRIEFDFDNQVAENRLYTDHAVAADRVDADDVGIAVVAPTSFVTTDTYEVSPFYNGQKLNMAWTYNAGALTNDNVIVQSCVKTTPANKLSTFTVITTLSWHAAKPGGVSADTAITVIEQPAASNKLTISEASMVLFKLKPTSQQMDSLGRKKNLQLVYNTFTLEQSPVNGALQQYNKQYVLEPMTRAAVLLNHNSPALEATTMSINSYRARLNNVFTTSRDVEINTPLWQDRTRATFRKMGSHVRNLVHNDEFIIGIPIRETETQQILDLTTSAVGGGTLDEVTIYLYKQQTRSINA